MAKNNLRMIAVKRDVFAQLRYIHDNRRLSYSDTVKMLLNDYYKDVVKEGKEPQGYEC
jgi:hypothetical protein